MKADIEKASLLEDAQSSEEPAKTRRTIGCRLTRAVLIFYAFVTVYVLAKRVFLKHHPGLDSEADTPGSWALDLAVNPAHPRLSGKKAEELFLATPEPASAFAASRAYATHPHLAGSSEDFEDAKAILQLFRSQFHIHSFPGAPDPIFPTGSRASRAMTLGINKHRTPYAWIDVYYPVMNTSISHSLELLDEEAGKAVWTAELEEDGDPRDPEVAKYRVAVPVWHGLSADSEAEGELVYVNYGRKEDYDEVLAKGGNFTGKVVLARYGAIFRGLKIQLAQTHGAAGVLIYSDPCDDGSVTVKNGYAPYPEGPARNPSAVQRGSVQFISAYPGDPTTPGRPAYKDAECDEGTNIPKIPSFPIGWGNAQRLLEELGGTDEGRVINGEASKRKVKLVNRVDNKVTPIWNTMLAIPGHIRNETVLLGCHRDAWVMGGADPVSGTVSLHEVIRGFGALYKSGWRPLRNIVIASWDAEEYGLIGSTEWAENFPEWISKNVVAYLNVDVSVSSSRWGASASPSLAHLIRQSAKDVPHPTIAGKTLWDAKKDAGTFEGAVDEEFLQIYEAAHASETGVSLLGSGSDYTPFLQRLGVASMDQGFGGTPTDAPYHYHSIYDSQAWQERYGDPGFHRHVAVAKHMGLTALRIIDAIVVPLNTTQYSLELDSYLDKVEDIASSLAITPDFTNLRSSIASLQSASEALDVEKADTEKKFKEALDKLPIKESHCSGKMDHPHLPDWLKKILHKIHRHRKDNPPKDIEDFIKAAQRMEKVNVKLKAFEAGFISEEGINEREWYKHLVVAPGKYLGYGATMLPAITEALTLEKNITLAEIEAKRVSKLIDNLAQTIAV
ncbi:Zn-dependent exopeptidase [Laetiporus sulphureus 93-53]|uniref:Zn-dependent exopeptidase n=1 Tax=Laetiporus sulphureus 93-53 TaxID=1314785 RepID=A0A165C3L9_9APHY|nr:Zn-dependent exopeptidase [Laetiporus sulphureus 93-53]KZT02146.1 Zn-dependent exopeptidase [Laetiporus sulphureus 93-53]